MITRTFRSWRGAAWLTAVALIVSACGNGDDGSGDRDDGGSTVQFTMETYQGHDLLGGDEVEFHEVLNGDQPVVLNFFAGRCPPCVTEMPWLEAAWQEFSDDLLLVGLDVGPFLQLGSNADGEALLADLDITYPAGYAVDDTPVQQLDVTNMPFTVFFDADGEITDSHGGMLTETQIRERFAELVEGA